MPMNPVTVTPLDWRYLANSPEIHLGNTGYTTLGEAITTIGSTNCALVVPATQTVTTQLNFPPNITLRFTPGATLDCTGMLDAAIENMTVANPCEVTVTGHGLSTNQYVRFYGIKQINDTAAEWMNLNNNVYAITKTGDNTFTIVADTSTYQAYNAETDTGRLACPIAIQGEIMAGKNQKIFDIDSPAQVVRGFTTAQFIASKQLDWYPAWFGAVGDGGTDDIVAVKATLTPITHSIYGKGIYHVERWYAISDTFSINDLVKTFGSGMISVQGIGRYNCGFMSLSGCYGKPLVEIVGTASPKLNDFGICGGTSTTNKTTIPDDAPSVGLMLGRSIINQNGGDGDFRDLLVCGFYQYGAIFDAGFATSHFDRINTSCSSLTDKATNYWDFSFFMGSGLTAYDVYPSLLPTNTHFMPSGNPSADGNYINRCSFTDIGDKAAGAKMIYLFQQGETGPTLTNIGFDCSNCDYHIYAYNSGVILTNGGGDSNSTYGIHLASSGVATRKAHIDLFTNKALGAVCLSTDDNTGLIDSYINNLRGNNGFAITLGAQDHTSSTFKRLQTISTFTSTGRLLHCEVDIPMTTGYSSGAGGYNNTIRYQRGAGGQLTVIDATKLDDY